MESTIYLSDMLDHASVVRQGWGTLGQNVCAHEPGKQGLTLQIGDKHYSKGLGSHAKGAIAIDLLGAFECFDAEVGVQKQASIEGSVNFRVAVDDKIVFDSGVMTQQSPAKSIHINVKGAQELVLYADPAGDGITCDCANWADAKLTRSPNPTPTTRKDFDIAEFATVCTWDPQRMDGARANRIEEYLADDVYLDQPLKPRNSGTYQVPANGCIGLLWLDRRRPHDVSLQFAAKLNQKDFKDIRVQAWSGTYPFQGEWKTLIGELSITDKQVDFQIDYSKNPDFAAGFRKLRWVIPNAAGKWVDQLKANLPSIMKTLTINLQVETAGKAQVELFNAIGADGRYQVHWDSLNPLSLKVLMPVGIPMERNGDSSGDPYQSARRWLRGRVERSRERQDHLSQGSRSLSLHGLQACILGLVQEVDRQEADDSATGSTGSRPNSLSGDAQDLQAGSQLCAVVALAR